MATLERAIEIAARAHAGEKDRNGQPYLLHPLRVMQGVQGQSAQIVAVLHDVVEDTEVTLEDLRQEGFSETVLTALELVTHGKDQTYAEYVVLCKPNDIARQVKLSDLRDNASLARVSLRPEKLEQDSKRMHRYLLSYEFLTDAISEQDYRELMVRYEK